VPFRVTQVAAVALLFFAGVPSAGLTECHLSPADLTRLKTLSSETAKANNPDDGQSLGIFYLDHRCYAEARKAFTAVVEGRGGRPTVRVAASGFLQFLDALILLDQGDLKLARSKLVQILKEDFHTSLLERVPFVLADILSRAPDPDAWTVLEESLRAMAHRGSWQAKALLANRLLAEGHGAEAIAQTEAELAGELEAPKRIGLQILLAHLLFAQKRVAEAQILIKGLDDEVGETILDPDLRINFLLLAINVWGERVRRGGDPTAAQKLDAYAKALNQLDSAIKPRGFIQ
jgi:hypothetical protein